MRTRSRSRLSSATSATSATSAMLAIATSLALAACSGEDGAQGPPGPAGPPGDSGTFVIIADGAIEPLDAQAGCTTPCHGFGNIVDQWRLSRHNLVSQMAAEEPIWTSTAACGNCHAVDGVPRRLDTTGDGGVAYAADSAPPTGVDKGHLEYLNGAGALSEAIYSGPGRQAIVYCTTCHAITPANDPHNTGSYKAGQIPLRVASGPSDFSLIEKSPAGATSAVGQSAGKFGPGNTCVLCHKSRKDVTLYITGSSKLNSPNWGPHEGPQADIYSGKGGYEFTLPNGYVYGTSAHATQLTNGCVDCHMQKSTSSNGTFDHTFNPQLAVCKTCHGDTVTGFNVSGGQTSVRNELRKLRAVLNNKGWLTRTTAGIPVPLTPEQLADNDFELDKTFSNPVSGPANKDQFGAVYNYLLVARGKDFGVHNPRYAKQLLFDSYNAVAASPVAITERPQ